MFKKLIFLGLVLLYSAVALKNETEIGDTNETAFKALHGPRYEKEFPGPAPVYEINLDLPYEERWRKVMTEIGKPHIEPLFNWFVGKAMLSDDVINALNFTVLEAYDKEFALEVQAIAKILELPFEKVLLLNTFFDATTMCTGIIIQDADNNVYHGRNLDFALAPVMSRMIFHGKYMKDGKLLYQAITKVGQVGLLTGIKKGAFTINLNQNMDPTTGADFYWNNIKHIVTGIYDEMKNHYVSQQTKKATHLKHVGPALKFSPLLIARKGIETCNSYEEMVQYLKDTPTFSRVFYIVAGTKAGEGTIITKKGDAVEHVKILDASTEYWFLLQANYAHNFTDPVYDNRYSAGKAQLTAIGKDHITKERLFNEVLHAYPIYNNGSIHTTIMQASTDLFNTTVWYWDESIKA